ncbi:MAG: alpha/beta hydrolase [Candidatus Nanopelagicaceae bacterium]|jgi:alpha/beta superfamily hydrolase
MPQTLRPSTVLPSNRTPYKVSTVDGIELVVEVAAPLKPSKGALLMCHPNPTGGGMMDSHVYKKAANRLPALADLTIVRFNTRGTSSEQGTSTGSYDQTKLEQHDVEAMIQFSLDQLKLENLWVVGWSFGTELTLKYAKDSRIKGIILLSPPLMYTTEEELKYWARDGRPVIALVPEHDEYLSPSAAREKFKVIPQIEIIEGVNMKHLWLGEPSVQFVHDEIVKRVVPEKYPLPTEI